MDGVRRSMGYCAVRNVDHLSWHCTWDAGHEHPQQHVQHQPDGSGGVLYGWGQSV